MFSFFKNKRRHEAVPEWATFLSQKNYQAFIKDVEDYFKEKD